MDIVIIKDPKFIQAVKDGETVISISTYASTDDVYAMPTDDGYVFFGAYESEYSQSDCFVGKSILFKNVSIGELKIFKERLKFFYEIGKLPFVEDLERQKDVLFRIIKVKGLFPKRAVRIIERLFFEGETKISLIESNQSNFYEIQNILEGFKAHFGYYCYPECKDLVEKMIRCSNNGTRHLVYCNRTFSEDYYVDESLIESVIENILTNQNVLESQDVLKIKSLFNGEYPEYDSQTQDKVYSVIHYFYRLMRDYCEEYKTESQLYRHLELHDYIDGSIDDERGLELAKELIKIRKRTTQVFKNGPRGQRNYFKNVFDD